MDISIVGSMEAVIDIMGRYHRSVYRVQLRCVRENECNVQCVGHT
jgi:hypothetical protein